ncbi:hypothetical protein MNV49_004707 [Pseudohyphozyma bogoriensis]|nr:hypothetical protein MNV49_004707 [Pseudohyphozyma bogoriensis]
MLFNFARTATLFLFAASTASAHSDRFVKQHRSNTAVKRFNDNMKRDISITQIQQAVYMVLTPFEAEVTSITTSVTTILSNSTLTNDQITAEIYSEIFDLISLVQAVIAQLLSIPQNSASLSQGAPSNVDNTELAQLLTSVFSSLGSTLDDVRNQLGSIPALSPVVSVLNGLLGGPLPQIVSGINSVLGGLTTTVQNLLSGLGLGNLVGNLGGGLNNLLNGLGLKQ